MTSSTPKYDFCEEEDSGCQPPLKFRLKRSSKLNGGNTKNRNGTSVSYDEGKTRRGRDATRRTSASNTASFITAKAPRYAKYFGSSLRKYRTYPRCFKEEVLDCAERHGCGEASKRYEVEQQKVRAWLRMRQIRSCTTRAIAPQAKTPMSYYGYPIAFRTFAIRTADDKGVAETAKLLSIDVNILESWVKCRLPLEQQHNVSAWETDCFVGIRRDILMGHDITIDELVNRASQIIDDQTEVDVTSPEWILHWCKTFRVLFKDQPATTREFLKPSTCLQLTCDVISKNDPQNCSNESKATRTRSGQSVACRMSKVTHKIDFDLWDWYTELKKRCKQRYPDLEHLKETSTSSSQVVPQVAQPPAPPQPSEINLTDGVISTSEPPNPCELTFAEIQPLADQSAINCDPSYSADNVVLSNSISSLTVPECGVQNTTLNHQYGVSSGPPQTYMMTPSGSVNTTVDSVQDLQPCLGATDDSTMHIQGPSLVPLIPAQTYHSDVVCIPASSDFSNPQQTYVLSHSVVPTHSIVNDINHSHNVSSNYCSMSRNISMSQVYSTIDQQVMDSASALLTLKNEGVFQYQQPPALLQRPVMQHVEMLPAQYSTTFQPPIIQQSNPSVLQPMSVPTGHYGVNTNYTISSAPNTYLQDNRASYVPEPAAASQVDYDVSLPQEPMEKKRNERYVPEFKLEVVLFVKECGSFKKAAEKFGVHHTTVAQWYRDRGKLQKLFPDCELVDDKPASTSAQVEQKFFDWLCVMNLLEVQVTHENVRSQVRELVELFSESVIKNECRWLYAWYKKQLGAQMMIDGQEISGAGEKDKRIAFPPLVKLEIVKIGKRQTYSETAKIFQIDRNCLAGWAKAEQKLRQMAKQGKIRRKDKSKDSASSEAELHIFHWYQEQRSQGHKPGPSEVQLKARSIYSEYGIKNIKCSLGWYSRWSKRFGIQLRYEKDDEILEWVLTKLENNRHVTHCDIQAHALQILSNCHTGFKCSSGWPIRFCKRHLDLLQRLPTIDVKLPELLDSKVQQYRKHVQSLQNQYYFSNAAIGAMDEVGLNFSCLPVSGNNLIRRCSFNSAQAVVVLSCLADGAILPPLTILKSSLTLTSSSSNDSFVFHQDELGIDSTLLDYWLKNVWGRFVPSPNLLILDCFDVHKELETNAVSTNVAFVPGGCATHGHPVVVWLRRKLQALVYHEWTQSIRPRTRANSPTGDEIMEMIRNAWTVMQGCQDDIRKSFVVTGAVVSVDHSEDHLIGKASHLSPVENEELYSIT